MIAREVTPRQRRSILAVVVGMLMAAVLPWASTAEGQQPARASRIGLLYPWSPPEDRLLPALAEAGWVEGKNLIVERRYAEGRAERLAELANELARSRVDLIFAWGPPAVFAAKNATQTIPIVFGGVYDPVRIGLVPNLARPGNQLTGVTFFPKDFGGKLLELLREAVPGVRRVAVLYRPPATGTGGWFMEDLQTAARSAGLQLQIVEVHRADELDAALVAIKNARPGALYAVFDGIFIANQGRIVDFALANRLPTIFDSSAWPRAGALLSYGPQPAEIFRRAAHHVDRVLRGAKPGELPVEQATRFELTINVKTAKALGLILPPSLLIRAEHVIE